MKSLIKNVVFGALVAVAAAGALTATAKNAHAAELCEECGGDSFMSGYMVASGLEDGILVCADADDPRVAEQCGGGGGSSNVK